MTTLTGRDPRVQDLLARRDLAVDLVRVGCVLLVVLLHSLMVGLSRDGRGAMVQTNPLQEQPWFPAASWLGQIMPLFFVLGGFASWQGWAGVRRRGGGARDFLRTRLLRLTVPAAAWFLLVGGGLWAAAAVGLPIAAIGALASGAGMPLWFLAAYLITQSMVPLLAHLHETRRWATVGVLLAAAVAVDVVRFASGVTEVGLLNLLVVWPLAQQLGFFLADGSLRRVPRMLLAPVAAAALAGVALCGLAGPYSADMLDDLNPPTAPLILIGVAQTALFLLAKPLLNRLMRRRAMQGVVLLLGGRLMTIYLWHLVVVILVCALPVAVPSLPQPGSAGWWWLRIPSTLAVLAIVLVLTLPLARLERWPAAGRLGAPPAAVALGVATLAAIVPPFVAMQWRLSLAELAWGSALLVLAVGIGVGRRPRAR